jgi:putative membrane protein insertion efficiency factor
MNPVQKILIFIIELYQRTLSPDHGWFRARYPHGFCRYYPSCSEYARQAVASRGAVAGLWLAARRVARCNPWVSPSVDAVPHIKPLA